MKNTENVDSILDLRVSYLTYKSGENVELYTLRAGTKMVFIAIHATSSSQDT